MSERCSACNGAIRDHRDTVKCAGPCGELFHVSCAQANEYVKTCDGLKNVICVDSANSITKPVTMEILNQVFDTFKKGLIQELQGSILKDVSDSSVKNKYDKDLVEIKKELSELRLLNEVLRNENAALVSQVKIMESKVNTSNKMFDDLIKVLRNLSKNIEENGKLTEEIKDELKHLKIRNETLENENVGLVKQIKVLDNKVNGLESSIKNITEKKIVSSEVVASGRPHDQTLGRDVNSLEPLHLDLSLPELDSHKVSMTGTTQKHFNFVVEHMGNKPVYALAGIGPVLGGRLIDHGYHKASQVYQQFLTMNKNKSMFQGWLKLVCNANVKQSGDCYQCLYDWNKNFDCSGHKN